MTTSNGRTADHDIHPLFLDRWSPRAFTGEAISSAEFHTILEAARWAPSSANAQPWRILYAHRESTYWPRFLGLLSASNQVWAANAATLLFILSKTVMRYPGSDRDVPSPTHSFDAGCAWGYLALETTRIGWHAHGMGGFDRERAIVELSVPEHYRVEAAVAIGRRGDPASLPAALAQRERPSSRQPLSSTVFEGPFPG